MGKNANGDDCECSWMDKAKAIGVVIAAVGSTIGVILGGLNLNKNANIEDKQHVQAQKTDEAAAAAEEVKKAVEARDVKTDKTVAKIDKIENVLANTTGSNLKASWSYLQRIADETQLPEDVEAARIAKKAYDDFVKKYGPGK